MLLSSSSIDSLHNVNYGMSVEDKTALSVCFSVPEGWEAMMHSRSIERTHETFKYGNTKRQPLRVSVHMHECVSVCIKKKKKAFWKALSIYSMLVKCQFSSFTSLVLASHFAPIHATVIHIITLT